MTTTFYFHSASSAVSGTLPSTQQYSSTTVTVHFDAVTVNRSMDVNVGTTQTSLTGTSTTGSAVYYYVTRFVSTPLAAQTIAANTWTVFDGVKVSASGGGSWPGGHSNGFRDIAIYVWRPSGGGSNIGFIKNGESSAFSNALGPTSEVTSKETYVGSSVTCIDQDVLCVEIITSSINATAGRTLTWYYDGGTVPSTDNAATSNIASFISTPQTLSFYTPSVTCTPTGKTVINKFIFKH